ncbi:MAG: GNAT family N-acetyltransferase [Steroidobacterales bacterium]
MTVVPGNLDDARVLALLEEHLRTARAQTAQGSAHALDPAALRSGQIDFWAIWDGPAVVGIGALKRLAADHGEIKSMHTAAAARRRGAGSALLNHIIASARAQGLARLSLETGSWDYFQPARAFYRRHGFIECAPFGEYVRDANSVFMTMMIR